MHFEQTDDCAMVTQGLNTFKSLKTAAALTDLMWLCAVPAKQQQKANCFNILFAAVFPRIY